MTTWLRAVVGVTVLLPSLVTARAEAESDLAASEDAVYQVAPLKSLLEGVLAGDTPFSAVLEHGDFGLATVNPLDGEVILLEGVVYRAGTDMKVETLPADALTPFATVKRFVADGETTLRHVGAFADIAKLLDPQLPTVNVPYAVRIDGTFNRLRLRSVPPQIEPYPRLDAVIAQQSVREFERIDGTLVGFRFPSYFTGVNATGYHFHFISRDRTIGGHVLDVQAAEVAVRFDAASTFTLRLPQDAAFRDADLHPREAGELERIIQPGATPK